MSAQGQFSAADIDPAPPPQKKVGQFSAADIDPPAKGFLDQVADYPKGIWENLVQTGQGMVNLATTDPRETIKGIGAAQDAMRVKALDAFKKGDYVTAGRHALEYLIPMAGPQMGEMGDLAQRGEVGRALGQATSLGLQMAGPGALHANAPAIVSGAEQAAAATKGAAQTAGAVTKAAVKAGAPDVAKGATRVGLGAAAAQILPDIPGAPYAKYLVAAEPVRAGVRQMGRGVTQGFQAGKAALADRIAAGLEAQRTAEIAAKAKATAPTPVGLLGPGPIAPEAPPDTSYVRSVPAEYPQPEAVPPKGLLGPGPERIITPPAPEDTSFVKSVPAEYPQGEGAPPAAPAAAATPAGPDPALLEGLAQGQIGKSFSKATPAEQSLIRNLASRLDQPVPEAQAAAPARAPQAPQEAPQPSAPGKTAAEMLRDELEARKATEAQPAAAQPPVAPEPAATIPEEETAPQLESPRSEFLASGERKSPLLRGEEIKGYNVEQKAERFAQAMHGYVSANELQLIPKGRVDPAVIAKGGVPGWGNITDDLIAKGLIDKDEVPPNASIPKIVSKLRELEAAANKAKLTPSATPVKPAVSAPVPESNQPAPAPSRASQTPSMPGAEVSASHPVADADYWGQVVARLAKDPRNITKAEWTALDPIREHLSAQDVAPWEEAKAVAERIAQERGDIKPGPGEGRSRRTEGNYNPLRITTAVAEQPSGRPAIESKPVQPSPGSTGKAVLQAALEKNKAVQPSAGEVASTPQRGIPEGAPIEQSATPATPGAESGKVELAKTEDGREFPQYNGQILSWQIPLTAGDEAAGFPRARAVITAMRDYQPERLARERSDALRGSFDRVFGHQSKKILGLIDEIAPQPAQSGRPAIESKPVQQSPGSTGKAVLQAALEKNKAVQPSAGEVASTPQRGIPEGAPVEQSATPAAREPYPSMAAKDEPIALVRDVVKKLTDQKLVDDSGSRVVEMMGRRAQMSEPEIMEIVSDAQKSGTPATGQAISDAYQRRVSDPAALKTMRELSDYRLEHMGDEFKPGGKYYREKPSPSGRPAIESKPVQPSPGLTGKAVLQAALEKNKAVQPSAGEVASTPQRGIPEAAPVEPLRSAQQRAAATTAAKKAKLTGKPATEPETVEPNGPILGEYRGDPEGAIKALRSTQSGEAIGALHHPELGNIDLVWGKAGDPATDFEGGFGLAHIEAKHPGVVDRLPEIISKASVKSKTANRAVLETADHKAVVRMTWDKQAKQWLLTAYEKK